MLICIIKYDMQKTCHIFNFSIFSFLVLQLKMRCIQRRRQQIFRPCSCFYSARVKAPSRPYSCTPFIAPFARLAPNPVIGTVAPSTCKFDYIIIYSKSSEVLHQLLRIAQVFLRMLFLFCLLKSGL